MYMYNSCNICTNLPFPLQFPFPESDVLASYKRICLEHRRLDGKSLAWYYHSQTKKYDHTSKKAWHES